MARQILVFVVVGFLFQSLAAQCPARDFLWRRIIYLRDSSEIPPSVQSAELNGYLKEMDHCPYRNDSTHALLLLRIGWLQGLQNNFTEAIRYTNMSVKMIHDHLGSTNINESHLIKCYNNLSYLYDSTGENILSRHASDSCIAISLRLKTGYDYAFGHLESKIIYLFGKGDFYDCIYYTDVADYVLKKTTYSPQHIYTLLAWKINALIILKKYPEATYLTDKSIREIKTTPGKIDLATFLGLKALIEIKIGHDHEAIRSTYESFSFSKKSGNNIVSAEVLNNLGYNLYFQKLRQYKDALKLYQEALKFANNNDSVSIFTNIANVYVAKNNFIAADTNYTKAFNIIYPEANENTLLWLSAEKILSKWNAENIVTLILDKAESYIKRFNYSGSKTDIDSAIKIFASADRLISQIKVTQIDLSSKLFWRTSTRRLFENAIASARLSGNMSAGFYFFEKSRAVLLNDQLNEQQTEDPDLIEIASVRKKIKDIENKILITDTGSDYNNLQRSVFIEKEKLNRLTSQIQEHNPWYYQSLLDTNIISLRVVQKEFMLDRQIPAVIEFFNGDSNIYVLFIRTNSCEIKEINKPDFENMITRYSTYLADPDKENKDFKDFTSTSNKLYNLIFKNISVPEGKMIISPDGQYFPFESLVVNDSTTDYFLSHHIVSYTYSVRFLFNDFKKTNSKDLVDFMGFAPVQFPTAFRLASLDHSDVSLSKIKSDFRHSDIFIRSSASKENFMRQFPDHKIIQLYTHSSDQSPNGEPVIFFSDSALYLSEILPGQKVNTQLIVLSACETGKGNLHQGEGVFSFNRSFASIGIPSAVINLWSVECVYSCMILWSGN